MPISEIAGKMGCSRKVVYNLIRKKCLWSSLSSGHLKVFLFKQEMPLLNLREENA
jgi:hypothetical protein